MKIKNVYEIEVLKFSLKMLQNCADTQKKSVPGNFKICNVNYSQSSCQPKLNLVFSTTPWVHGDCAKKTDLFWLAGTLGIINIAFLKIALDGLFLSVGAILKHFERQFKLGFDKHLVLKKSKIWVFWFFLFISKICGAILNHTFNCSCPWQNLAEN